MSKCEFCGTDLHTKQEMMAQISDLQRELDNEEKDNNVMWEAIMEAEKNLTRYREALEEAKHKRKAPSFSHDGQAYEYVMNVIDKALKEGGNDE